MTLLSDKNISPKENYKAIQSLKNYGKLYVNDVSAFNTGEFIHYMVMDNNTQFRFDPASPLCPSYFTLVRRPGVSNFNIGTAGILPIYANSYIGGVVQQVQDTLWIIDGPVNGVEVFIDKSQSPKYVAIVPIMT